jgi:diacylglycerol kinase (ATP)
MEKEKIKPARETGFAHFTAAARYSLGGLRRVVRESAFRQEVGGGVLVLALIIGFGASLPQILGFLVLWLILVAAEALNTAIEALVDHVSPHWSEAARDAKDLGSFAVSCLIGANAIYVIWVLFS